MTVTMIKYHRARELEPHKTELQLMHEYIKEQQKALKENIRTPILLRWVGSWGKYSTIGPVVSMVAAGALIHQMFSCTYTCTMLAYTAYVFRTTGRGVWLWLRCDVAEGSLSPRCA